MKSASDIHAMEPGSRRGRNSLELFGQHLIETGSLTPDSLSRAAIVQGGKGLEKLWEATGLSAGEFTDRVAGFFKLQRIPLPDLMVAAPLTRSFSARFLRESLIFPCIGPREETWVVVADPTDTAGLAAAQLVLGDGVQIRLASFEDITTVLNARTEEPEQSAAEDAGHSLQGRAEDDVESLRDLASGAPVVRALNDLFEKAVDLRATDIHIEPFRNSLTVRMRVDGVLRPTQLSTEVPAQALVSRAKILAGMNIAERRLPQDGSARVRFGRSELDVRIATMPTQYGESAVMRLLPKDRSLLDFGRLGFGAADDVRLRRLLALPHGMVVVTGPTGSGKTTSLATMLSLLNSPGRKILTVEDPVEYEIPGINQSQVKPEIGLTFANALRSFVRQDPDVIMVGEVRDSETAHIAVHAALTGHLVLTTLHTETAAAAVPRLIDLGVEPFLLRSVLRGVIAQRLVRLLCERCKRSHELTAAEISEDPRFTLMGFQCGEVLFEPGRCDHCSGTGYRGRCGVFEVLEMNDDVRPLVDGHHDAPAIEQIALRNGMTTMQHDGVAKCRAGMTSPEEVLRVVAVR